MGVTPIALFLYYAQCKTEAYYAGSVNDAVSLISEAQDSLVDANTTLMSELADIYSAVPAGFETQVQAVEDSCEPISGAIGDVLQEAEELKVRSSHIFCFAFWFVLLMLLFWFGLI